MDLDPMRHIHNPIYTILAKLVTWGVYLAIFIVVAQLLR